MLVRDGVSANLGLLDLFSSILSQSGRHEKLWNALSYVREHDWFEDSTDPSVKKLYDECLKRNILSKNQRKHVRAWIDGGAPFCVRQGYISDEDLYLSDGNFYFSDGATSDDDRRWCD